MNVMNILTHQREVIDYFSKITTGIIGLRLCAIAFGLCWNIYNNNILSLLNLCYLCQPLFIFHLKIRFLNQLSITNILKINLVPLSVGLFLLSFSNSYNLYISVHSFIMANYMWDILGSLIALKLLNILTRPPPVGVNLIPTAAPVIDIDAHTNVLNFDKHHDNAQFEQQDCSICKDPFTGSQQLRLLQCKHFFHKSCVDDWLNTHNTCPVCFVNIITPHP